MPRILVFDVNETLLDLAALDPAFARVFGDAAARLDWFAQMLRDAFVLAATGVYHDFGTIGRAALELTAERWNVTLADGDRAAILDGMRRLPPHPEVPTALRHLQDAGLRLAALTNSAQAVADEQLANAGLYDRFEQVLSVGAARQLKPHPAVYRMAAERLGAEPAALRLIAAHDWDVSGAIRAGWAGAFVARPGTSFSPLAERPDVTGPDLRVVAERILKAELGS